MRKGILNFVKYPIWLHRHLVSFAYQYPTNKYYEEYYTELSVHFQLLYCFIPVYIVLWL